jgi:hypothetical protein
MTRPGDDAERSDAEEWRKTPAGDDAERSDAEEWRKTPAGDDDAGTAGIEQSRAA